MITVKLFAVLKKLAGTDEITMAVPAGGTVKDVIAELSAKYPEVGKLISQRKVMLSINQEAAEDQMKVKSGDELAVLPPFAGGAEVTAAEVDQLVRVQEGPFDVNAEIELVKRTSKGIGAVVTFLGIGRDHSKGKDIEGLTFEYYAGMAEKRLKQIREQAIRDFNLIECGIVHRFGDIALGEDIVLINAASSHRPEAFEACRWCIDELKRITPIWKKEFTPEGEVWVEEHP
ncbi:MAG: MoaD family protein [Nitrospirota bacterium]|nr:MoaD family protein [Nitrospirota bacterium]